MSDRHAITSLEALEALYGAVNENSLAKETGTLTPEYRRWIEAAPFFAIASAGPGGLDCSPRGDAKGQLFRCLDDKTLAVPDRRGNNRLDTLRNILADPRVALLFLIPGINETLRVNGRATITTDPELVESFAVGDKRPASVILVEIDSVYFQCARALARAKLWDPDLRIDPGEVPTAGQMTRAAKPGFDAEGYDAGLPARQRATLY
ncbi:MAG: pyridoxamine 5'-phosphate oxidase family protein [Kiloniellales bacterium]|nr:pyridoxamine 5'-phosphate oxidase family protein [Kiloniellales bacterium]